MILRRKDVNWLNIQNLLEVTYTLVGTKRRVEDFNIPIAKLMRENYRQPTAIDTIVLHGLYTEMGPKAPSVFVEDIANWHIKQRKFLDIGYHYYISKKGRIFSCRPLAYAGAHCKMYNGRSIGIALEGGKKTNSKDWEDNYTSDSKESLAALVEFLCQIFSISCCRGHRQFDSKRLCPGTTFDCEFLSADHV